ncbi:mitochondrial escape protein 2 [Coemansia spiralis]|uniref:Mitochondrial escape protein 2 n=1 Tax=Coemansia spiralis TaxID=417178 RepID=A0A9W8G8V0_9FUNG|nr:mitochondrial escape protein 2 [Coemansia spiralis]
MTKSTAIDGLMPQLLGVYHSRHIHIERYEKGDSTETHLDAVSAKYRAGLFINKIFPLKMGRLDIRPFIISRDQEAMKRKVVRLIPQDLPYDFSISEIEPHSRDGGSIVYFTFAAEDGQENAKSLAERLVKAVDEHLSSRQYRSWFDFTPIRSFPVKGVPFCEDIVRLLPSKKVRVEFIGPDLTVEQIYNEFREFGRILDIETQPSSNKDSPRWAIVHFVRLHAATSARNCVHGSIVGSTKLMLSYVKENKENVVIQWIKGHSKFTIPLAAAALIAAIYAVFDPIREFFVENKITHRFDLDRIPILGNVKKAAMRSIMRRSSDTSDDISAWSGLADQRERLSSILDEPPDSFIVVAGPHGSGKTNMVQQATQNKKYRVAIDANMLAAQHSELEQMTVLARELGWWPVFNSIISITNAIDLMVTATTGSNAGISATPESQVRRILECLALVLARIRHGGLAELKDKHNRKQQESTNQGGSGIAPLPRTLPPEDIPVIILDNFMDKDIKFTPIILDWAAGIVEAGLAHCIFTTSNISGYHEIQRAQPQRAASLVSLNDATPMGAITLLQQQLAPTFLAHPADTEVESSTEDSGKELTKYQHRLDMVSSDRIAYAASILGGRLEDLHVFVQKVNAGETIDGALEDIIQRSITEIRKYAFSDDSEVGKCEHTWTPEQFWCLLTELAKHNSIEYDRMRNSPLFVGDDKAFLGLAEAQLITMVYDNDRPSRILPGRPVFYTAFNRILENTGFSSTMSIKMNKKYVELETAKIRKAEEELSLLNVFRTTADTYSALTSSMAMIAASRGAHVGGSAGHSDRRWIRGWSGDGDSDKNSASSARNSSSESGDMEINPEAFIAQAVRASGQGTRPQDTASGVDNSQNKQTGSSQSWFGWLFGRSSKNNAEPGTQPAQHNTQSKNGSLSDTHLETTIPGVPHELQGRVRFLLQTIHNSQQKIDKWDFENQTNTRRLASL